MSVQIEINSTYLSADHGRSLFDCAEEVGVRIPNSCRKNGKCRECLLEVVEGMQWLSDQSEEELHLRDRFRLACRATISAKEGTIRCHTLRRGQMRIEDEVIALQDIPGPVLHDPAIERDAEWVLLEGQPLVRQDGPLLGLAIDAGTTTIVLRLVDLESRQILNVQSFENPQRFAGSDVMARIHYDSVLKGHLLQRTLVAYLGHAIEAMPCDAKTIYEVVVAGNTTMRDLLFGLDVHSIGQRPYRSITEHALIAGDCSSTSLITSGKKLRLPICPDARIVGLPLIGGHVGADTAACLLAIGMAHEHRTVALMDIGTNTELVVGNRKKILAASCPAGPAFEGGAIQCGMPGLEGAVESVHLSELGKLTLEVIDGGLPQGICGSGLIDLISELLRTGRIDQLGRFTDDSQQFSLDASQQLYLHEKDISELAQAKGANVAGLRIVLNRYGIEMDQLDRFYLAGGFARHLDLDAARRIGLIPNLPDEKLVQVGNASIEGAMQALCSVTRREELESLVAQVDHVELETDEHFFDHFVDGCQFVPM